MPSFRDNTKPHTVADIILVAGSGERHHPVINTLYRPLAHQKVVLGAVPLGKLLHDGHRHDLVELASEHHKPLAGAAARDVLEDLLAVGKRLHHAQRPSEALIGADPVLEGLDVGVGLLGAEEGPPRQGRVGERRVGVPQVEDHAGDEPLVEVPPGLVAGVAGSVSALLNLIASERTEQNKQNGGETKGKRGQRTKKESHLPNPGTLPTNTNPLTPTPSP